MQLVSDLETDRDPDRHVRLGRPNPPSGAARMASGSLPMPASSGDTSMPSPALAAADQHFNDVLGRLE